MTFIGDIYRLIYSKFNSKPTNFGWILDNKLAGSGLPISFEQFKWVINSGVRSIVTVRETPLPPEWFDFKFLRERRFETDDEIAYLHLKVEDYHAPSISELTSTIAYIENRIRESRPVLVHCAAGKGRTGTILAAYIVKYENLDPKKAIEKIRSFRPGSIQTKVQEEAIYEYWSSLRENK